MAATVNCKLKRTPEDYVTDRLQYKINQYTEKSRRYPCLYWLLASSAAILVSAAKQTTLRRPLTLPLSPRRERAE